MYPEPSFWAALRLAAFANLPVTEDNWGTLWVEGELTFVWGAGSGAKARKGKASDRTAVERLFSGCGPRDVRAGRFHAALLRAFLPEELAMLWGGANALQGDIDPLPVILSSVLSWSPSEIREGQSYPQRALERLQKRWKEEEAAGRMPPCPYPRTIEEFWGLAAKARAEEAGLWNEFCTWLREHKAPMFDIDDADTALLAYLDGRRKDRRPAQRLDKLTAALGEYPYRPWPRLGSDGKPIAGAECLKLHQRTRERLRAIAAGGDLRAFVRGLVVRGSRVVRLREGGVPGLLPFTRDDAHFWADEEPVQETLEAHLDALFIRTAVGGMWPKITVCAGPECDQICVPRVKEPRSFCSPRCRERTNRPGRQAQRTARQERLKAELRKHAKELEKSLGMSRWDARVAACKTSGMTDRKAIRFAGTL